MQEGIVRARGEQDLSKERRRPATHREALSSGIERGLHFGENGGSR